MTKQKRILTEEQKEIVRERSRKWYHDNKARAKKRMWSYRYENPETLERLKAYQREYYQKHKNDPGYKERMRQHSLARYYRLKEQMQKEALERYHKKKAESKYK